MPRPLIGITGQLEAAHWGDWVREAVISPVTYTRAVERAGGTPVVLPPVPADSVARLIGSLDGLVLSGGTDVNPALYDAAPHEKTDPPDRRRDRFELSLARAAIEAQLPVLAICRGMHVLNVARGGTLIQYLPDAVGHDGHAPDPVKMTPHDIQLSAGSQLGKLLGTRARVPALHHQAIQRAGSGLMAVGWAEDQVIEAVELQGHRFAVGVQWHPEEGDDLRVFEALVAATYGTEEEPDDDGETPAAADAKPAAGAAEGRASSTAPVNVTGRRAGGRKAGTMRGARA
jgi:gamma-glutamyl-gamma-aminobutyrate hydrolase PuuD